MPKSDKPPGKPIDPTAVIGEILGEPAAFMRNPVNAGYECPFINSKCIKVSHRFEDPYPVCSIHRSRKDQHLICTCPKRMFEADLLNDVITNCWVGTPPLNPRLVSEVTMAKFGKVDFVVADVDEERHLVRNFISAELQAVDITGSVEPAYTGVTNSTVSIPAPRYGINWANVRKRYISPSSSTKGFIITTGRPEWCPSFKPGCTNSSKDRSNSMN